MPGRPTTPGAFPRAALFAASMSLMTNNFSITNLFPYVRILPLTTTSIT